MQDDRFVLYFEMLEGLYEKREIMTVDRAVITHSKFFKQDVGKNQVLRVAFHLVGEFTHGLTTNFTDKFSRLVTNR